MTDALASCTVETFSTVTGSSLDVLDPDSGKPGSTLTVVEARELPNGRPGQRTPFSVVFEGDRGAGMPQGTYLIKHESVGEMAIFIVPIADRDNVRQYQAIFT